MHTGGGEKFFAARIRDTSARPVDPAQSGAQSLRVERSPLAIMEAAFVQSADRLGRYTRARLPLRWRWTLACGAGETIGFVYPALAALLLVFFFDGAAPLGLPGKLLALMAMIAAGALEGATLGLFQARILADHLPGFRVRRWVAATAAVAALLWALGTGLALFGAARAAEAAAPPLTGMLLDAAGLGLAVGILFGGGQWIFLRRHATGAVRWIGSWGLAFALALTLIVAAGSLPREASPAALVILAAAATAGAAGLVLGVLSSFGAAGLKPRRSERASA